ncbi:NAD(P) transhydrogenase subunit alpha [Flavimobilis marinus]|uniref:proton-translocating NAD(P)(+) transhydrogenase n=1 Tax=Flavimobilis marinus TaxID=285351 RepID=A0A1I2HF75_9MICO|nr:NAD(P) transhydrogenase subunit alpha [Flavimobilis marinus]GHG57955.1 NAD(P) transhydrogenase subunit alpha [Flavimobilis marinus]SFF27406.1 NAD(P) transhydrogenase subunit alpha [Flavimobilis marinus]
MPDETTQPTPVAVGVLREAAGERRVALVPEVVETLVSRGLVVRVEAGAGTDAWFADDVYVAAGAQVTSRAVAATSDVVVSVHRPGPDVVDALTPGQTLIGLLGARADREGLVELERRGVRALSLDLLPRTLSRAQTMDALSSQASVAGYRAALLGAETFARYLPMMITAAGTARPAKVLVLGAGVAGLQAIGTARRLGAQVTGYDVRPAAREEVTSLGATFLTTSVTAGAGEGGYARALTAQETAAQQAELGAKIAGFDIVITTAQVPGARPPLLVTEDTLDQMAPGSVLVDLAASALGGNVAGSAPGQSVVTDRGVTIVGAHDLPSRMATGASTAYARNIAAVLGVVVADDAVVLDPADEVVGALWVGADLPAAPAPVTVPSVPTVEGEGA